MRPTLLTLLATATATIGLAAPPYAGAAGVSAVAAGVVTATGTAVYPPADSMVLDATCSFSVVGALDGDLHVQSTGVAVAAATTRVSSSSVTCIVYDATGSGGSATATARGGVAVLRPTITLAGPAPFRVCVMASATGAAPASVTIPETCSIYVPG